MVGWPESSGIEPWSFLTDHVGKSGQETWIVGWVSGVDGHLWVSVDATVSDVVSDVVGLKHVLVWENVDFLTWVSGSANSLPVTSSVLSVRLSSGEASSSLGLVVVGDSLVFTIELRCLEVSASFLGSTGTEFLWDGEGLVPGSTELLSVELVSSDIWNLSRVALLGGKLHESDFSERKHCKL